MTPYGILDVGPWQAVAAALILTHITIASVTIYLHRQFRRIARWSCMPGQSLLPLLAVAHHRYGDA